MGVKYSVFYQIFKHELNLNVARQYVPTAVQK